MRSDNIQQSVARNYKNNILNILYLTTRNSYYFVNYFSVSRYIRDNTQNNKPISIYLQRTISKMKKKPRYK